MVRRPRCRRSSSSRPGVRRRHAASPAEPRNAATVVLLRRGEQGPEVYLLRRQTSMAFAGGMCVFPGGGVDPRDFDHAVAWAGPTPAEWAHGSAPTRPPPARWSAPRCARRSRSPACCWPGSPPTTVVADTTGDDWEADRVALEARELSLTDFLDRRGLVLRSDLLGAWAGWLTPVFEPRRYRTWFFVADLPEGQRTRDVSTESAEVDLAAGDGRGQRSTASEMFMLPPTYLTCLEVAEYADPDAVLAEAADRDVEMFTPELTERRRRPSTLSDPRRASSLLAARAMSWTGGAFGERAPACSRRTPT